MAEIVCAPWRSILIVVYGDGKPGRDEWTAYTAVLKRELGTRYRQRGLIITRGVVMENYQRKEVDAIIGPSKEHDRRIAVATTSTFVRGVVKGLSLWDPSYKSFSLDDLDDALRYLEAPESSHAEARRVIADMEAKVFLK